MTTDGRYLRQLILAELGLAGQRRLSDARVAVIGAGGLGAPVLSYLAGAGVGHLTLIDDDIVDLTNLHRQVIHDSTTVGQPKVTSAAAALHRLNPDVAVVTHQVRLTAANAADLLADHHLVVDGTDNFPTRYLIDDAAADLGLPVIWGSVLRFDGQVSMFDAAAGIRYRDVFPTPPPAAPSCETAGVLGPVCGLVGSMMALEALKHLAGVGRSLLGRMLVLDGLRATWREIPLAQRPAPSRDLAAAQPMDRSAAPPHVTNTPQLFNSPEDDVVAGWLERLLADPPVVVDLREPQEARERPLPRSVRLAVTDVLTGDHRLDPAQDHLVVCELGRKSLLAAQLLQENGFSMVNHLPGGVMALVRTLRGEPWPWRHAETKL